MIDIIIPTHDGWSHLELCIKAVERFTKNPFKLIIVNNGSTKPETARVLSEAKDRGHRVVELLSNQSFSKAINAGIAESRGEYVVLLNDDVYVIDGWDAIMLAEISDPAVGMVGAQMPGAAAGFMGDPTHAETLPVPYLVFAHVMIRRDVIEKVGVLDAETFTGYGSEDLDYCWRAIDAGFKLKVSQARSLHIGGASMKRVLGDRFGEYDRMHIKLVEKWGEERVRKSLQLYPRVALAVPTYNGKIDNDFFHCAMLLDKTGPFQLEIFQTKRMVVHYAREKIAELCLEQGFDYIWWLDDDMVFPPDTLTRLMAHKKPVVSALAYQRREPYNCCLFKWKTVPHLKDYGGTFDHLNGIERTGLRKIDACGAACMLMETSVLRKLADKRPWFDNKKFGEDLHFCKLCEEAGIPIYGDTDLIIGHIGDPVIVDEGLVARFKASKQQQSQPPLVRMR